MEYGADFGNRAGLETVRTLHQTVIALRAALEESKSQILELKRKSLPIESIQGALNNLSAENKVLRSKLLEADTKTPKEVSIQLKPVVDVSVKNGTEFSEDNLLSVDTETKSSDIFLNTGVRDNKKSILDEQLSNVDVKNSVFEKDKVKKISNKSIEKPERSEINVHSPRRATEGKTEYGTNIDNTQFLDVDLKYSRDRTEEGLTKENDKTSVLSNNNNEIILDNRHIPKETGDKKGNELKKKVTFPNLVYDHKQRTIEAKILIKTETISPRNISKSSESLTVIKSPLDKVKTISFSKTLSFSNLTQHVNREFKFDPSPKMSDRNQSTQQSSRTDMQEDVPEGPLSPQNDLDQAEVDDIELIFTTDDTKDSDFKEQLVSIDTAQEGLPNLLELPLNDMDANLDISDREMDDDVFNDNFENENQDSFKRDICDSKSDMSLNQEKSLKSYYSLQDSSFDNKSLDKDESFDKFEERIHVVETDISKCGIHDIEYNVQGRRNTCPNPLSYKPLLHRETISKGLAFSRRSRPILNQSNARRKESGAQTDISALPGSAWRSESSLAPRAQLGENFTTLPSKCPLPGSRLRLSEKTVEARRVLLSDIGFTSMVPELSRSADHLFQTELKPPPPVYGQFLRATDLYSPAYPSQKFQWNTTSTSTTSQCHSHYSSMYHLSSPPAPSRRFSAPGSPSRKNLRKSLPSKVRFANGSLPELRGDWTTTIDSGDSTDSLVEEAENYLRRSIDCIVTTSDKKPVPRRASAPEPSGDNVPPAGWQPFLPRVPRDLKLDHWVKVITPEGRVRGGRVRYIGAVVSQMEQFVGVQLSTPDGYCDGTYNSRRYFQCEPYHGIFVPFKKVIMGWRP